MGLILSSRYGIIIIFCQTLTSHDTFFFLIGACFIKSNCWFGRTDESIVEFWSTAFSQTLKKATSVGKTQTGVLIPVER